MVQNHRRPRRQYLQRRSTLNMAKNMALKVRTLCLLLVLLVIVFIPLFAQNTELQLLQNELFQAQLAVKDAKASRWPTLELSITGSWMQNPPLGPITLSSDQL
ncbi:MAG: hypothetical protein EOM15_15730, partial [Spirochaetia bacterium]|nr:hypothetical protein [Spirochaetia bacterium]